MLSQKPTLKQEKLSVKSRQENPYLGLLSNGYSGFLVSELGFLMDVLQGTKEKGQVREYAFDTLSRWRLAALGFYDLATAPVVGPRVLSMREFDSQKDVRVIEKWKQLQRQFYQRINNQTREGSIKAIVKELRDEYGAMVNLGNIEKLIRESESSLRPVLQSKLELFAQPRILSNGQFVVDSDGITVLRAYEIMAMQVLIDLELNCNVEKPVVSVFDVLRNGGMNFENPIIEGISRRRQYNSQSAIIDGAFAYLVEMRSKEMQLFRTTSGGNKASFGSDGPYYDVKGNLVLTIFPPKVETFGTKNIEQYFNFTGFPTEPTRYVLNSEE